jgi:tetratricopeptide (TPR) repeat protein
VHHDKGDYEKALDYFGRSLAICEELGDKRGMGYGIGNIGIVSYCKGDYKKAEDYLEKSLATQKEIGLGEGSLMLETTTYLYLTYKHLGKDYDEKDIHSLIKDAENIEFEINQSLYKLLCDKSYLETAYKQVQEKASAMDDKLSKKFLSYPIPKAIVEEYNKVFKTK